MEHFGWTHLLKYIRTSEPDYLILSGDQVYTDAKDVAFNLWRNALKAEPRERRRAFVEAYQGCWERTAIRDVMASLPVAMMWDDHEIRDGWGSRPGDTDTLLSEMPRGRKIVETFGAYYHDAREAFWHFQRCHGPIGPFPRGFAVPELSQSPRFGVWRNGASAVSAPEMERFATMEYWFDVGSTRVIMFDGRGARDFYREPETEDAPVNRVNGDAQWAFIRQMIANLPSTVRAVVPVTGVPIVANGPKSLGEEFLGDFDDDLAPFARGDLDGLLAMFSNYERDGAGEVALSLLPESPEARVDAIRNGRVTTLIPGWRFSGKVREWITLSGWIASVRELVDDVRDGWAHERNRDEAGRLIRLFASLDLPNRPGVPMPVVFLGGDIHVGGRLKIRTGNGREFECVVGSAIAKESPSDLEAGLVVGTAFRLPPVPKSHVSDLLTELNSVCLSLDESVLDEIGVKLIGEAVRNNNFAVTRLDPTAMGAQIENSIVFVGEEADVVRFEVVLGPMVVSTM